MEDTNRTKHLVYVALILAGILIIGYFVYRYLSPAVPTAPANQGQVGGKLNLIGGGAGEGGPTGTTTETEAKQIPEVTGKETGPLVQLAAFPVVSPALDRTKKKILFYKKDGGDLYSVNFDGTGQEKISNITIVGLTEALWSIQGDRAAVFYLDQDTSRAFLHIGTSSVATLPQNIRSFSWSPDGKSLAYLLPSGDKLNLLTADAAGKGARTIFSTPLFDSFISWVTSDRIALETAPSGLAEGYLFGYSRANGSLTRILGPLFGLMSLWSPDGSRVLISSTKAGGKTLDLSIYDSKGSPLLNTGVSTIGKKCVWKDNNEALCAVPLGAPAAVWPDDYLRGAVNTADKLVSINIPSKEVTELFSKEFDMSDLVFAGDYLVFVDRRDGTLWSYRLK